MAIADITRPTISAPASASGELPSISGPGMDALIEWVDEIAALTKPDFNPANGRDSAVVTVLLTCRVAANGGLRCSPGQAYTGPDDRPLANSSQALFDGQCCVSAAASVLAGCSSTCGMRAVQC